MTKKGTVRKGASKESAHFDQERAAYMIAWRDRHIEKLKEVIEGYGQQQTLMEALLAFALFRATGGTDGSATRELEIPKDALRALLGEWECETEANEESYLVRFFKKGEREDAAHPTQA